MTNPSDLEAAQPTLSDPEFNVLLRALKIDGDAKNEHDRERAMETLNAVLLDSKRSDELLAALEEIAGAAANSMLGEVVFAGPNAKPITRRVTNVEAATAMIDDVPSTGRLLNALHDRTALMAEKTGAPEVVTPEPTHSSNRSTEGIEREFFPGRSAVGQTEAEYAPFIQAQLLAFLAEARDALPKRSPSWLERLAQAYEAMKGSGATSWQAANFVMHSHLHHFEGQLRHGPREWHVEVQFLEPKVTVSVTNVSTTVIERDVARSKPEDFSRTLLDAFDGDVSSTRMALDAVQQALAIDGRAVH
ncbi:MAG TPA: hypothetical protein VF446_11890 [Trinickia sp.]